MISDGQPIEKARLIPMEVELLMGSLSAQLP